MKEAFSKKQLRELGLLIGFGFSILIVWLLPSIAGHQLMAWIFYLGIAIILLALFQPKPLKKTHLFANETWNTLYSTLIVVLSLAIYVLLVIPTSLVMKILGHDPLKRRFNDTDSYREPKKQIFHF